MNNINEIFSEQLKKTFGDRCKIKFNEPMATRTTFGVGGRADVFIEPEKETDLAEVIRLCNEHNVKFYILGRGSNVLVKDGGIRGVVIHLAGYWFERIVMNGIEIECGAAARLKAIAGEAKKSGITGFEFLEGIPGTVGGALRMNAGAMGGEIFNLVKTFRLMDYSGNINEINAEEARAKYRECEVLKNAIALSAMLRGKMGEQEKISKKMEDFAEKRQSSQPKERSAGCVFKNPPGLSAGKLVDELGLKGKQIGGAMVSNEHGNFIVNTGGAKTTDILALIDFIKNEVKQKNGILLETELEIIGEDL